VTYRPLPGQVALLERPGAGDNDMTGLVGAADDDHFEIDLGLGNAVALEPEEVVVNVCAPEALYRLSAKASPGRGQGIVVLTDVHELERIQRRTAVRVPIRLGVSLACLDDPSAGLQAVSGYTIDIGVGGVQVQTLRPLPDCDPTVMLTLPDGTRVAALSLVLQTTPYGDGYRSRLCFQDLPAEDMTALSALVQATAPA
jgi:hypothetical protein